MNQQRALVAAVAMGAVLVMSACSGDDAEPTSTTATAAETTTTTSPPPAITPETTTTATTTTTEPDPTAQKTASSDAALATKDTFFVAFNAADPATVMELFTIDAQFTDNFGPSTRQDFEQLLVWNVAQGTRYTPSDCTAASDTESGGVVVSCEYVTHDALSIASGGPPVPFTMRMLITSDGIVDYFDQFGTPSFSVVGTRFNRWMNEHHPEDTELVAFGTWTTIEEAVTNGMFVAHYANEWGDYLDANNCAYDDNC